MNSNFVITALTTPYKIFTDWQGRAVFLYFNFNFERAAVMQAFYFGCEAVETFRDGEYQFRMTMHSN